VPRALSQFAEVIDHWAKLADNTHQLTTLRNLAVLLRRASAPQAAAELLGALERDDSTYAKKQNGSKRCASGHARSSVTKCSPATSPLVGSAMSPPQRSGPSTCLQTLGADVNVSRGRPLRGGLNRPGFGRGSTRPRAVHNAPHRGHPNPQRHPRPRLLPTQAGRGQIKRKPCAP
jgi:hypothetical protein